MYTVRKITNSEEWEAFVKKQPYTLFVQSWHYGEFFASMGEQFWIFGIFDGDELTGGSLVVSTHAKRGNFLYLPYGPILPSFNQEILKLFTNFLKDFARRGKYDFIRVSPFCDDTPENRGVFRQCGYRSAPIHMLAETTWMLDLHAQPLDELFSSMEKNHRNLIRRCEREGVRIEKGRSDVALAAFNRLHDITAKRHDFVRFSADYVEKEFNLFALHDEALIVNAYLSDGRLDSSAIVMYYGNMAAYRHGASGLYNKHVPTSYLVQWEAIEEAKRRGIRWYNFWGIAPGDAPASHPFKGITHFKKGFGGVQKDLLHCQDIPLTSRYWINWAVESFRRIKRGF